MKQTTVLFYISGHGLGHTSRVSEIINVFSGRNPGVRILIRTGAPRWFFDVTLKTQFDYYACTLDVGAVQYNYFSVDIVNTLNNYRELLHKKDSIIGEEVNFVAKEDVSVIFCDIPPFACDVASKVGIPSIAHGNFSWDWIYTPYVAQYPEYKHLVDAIRSSYQKATVLLRLPFYGDMSVFPNIVDIPFVARRSVRDASEVKKVLGLPDDRRIVLVSFGGIGISLSAVESILELRDYVFITTQPDGMDNSVIRFISNNELVKKGILFEDVVHASDVVMSKPSYGIISECIANRVRFIYSNRVDFIETKPLIAGVKQCLPCAEIRREDLFSGMWSPYLDNVMGQQFDGSLPAVNGSEAAAETIERYLKGK